MKPSGYHISSILFVMMAMLTSCRNELCYNHYHAVKVELSWERVWERDYGMALAARWDAGKYGFEYSAMNPALPEWVNLVKFNGDGSPKDNFLTIKGGEVHIENSGEESFLLYNGDTEYIVLEDMASLTDARATTTSRSRSSLQYLQSLAPNTRTANPPDLLYAAYVDKLPSVDLHQTLKMPIKMQPLVYTYIIRYEFEYGLQHVAIARGAIGGMAESVYLRNGVTSDETAILLYDCFLTDYGCEAHVRSFGVPSFPDEYYGKARKPGNDTPVAVNLEVRLKSGKYMEFNFDVSDQIKNQPRGGVINIKGIHIEDEENKVDAGFDVDVSSWDDPVNIELPM